MKRTLPTDSAERKNYPIFTGCIAYFPAAIAGIARISKKANERHNPGEPMHHARGKSMDHSDCIPRHLHDAEELVAAYDRGEISDEEIKAVLEEVDQLAWRSCAYSQQMHERFGNAPLAMGARLPEVKAAGIKPEFAFGPTVIYKPGAQVDADGGAVSSKARCACGADLSFEPHRVHCQF